MQDQLNTAEKWCHDNGLVITATKIKITHLSNSDILIKFHNNECLHKGAKNSNLNDDTCSTVIEQVETYKYLGVYVDNTFKWKAHITSSKETLKICAYALPF